ncbi:translation initiation factor 2A [Fistulifera solaris]|uniref:Eukaryotic translation initiation factor 2A n=1 Tax=Fistulifera solaris TaxID=1519565 RepID=A0A1Z5KN26_FISSO|nr:translation initiation factor 2A [Fistulifera solaris]|eukprot:GAX27338.1 translation initiation factor 2A [Fistulifera solaris]
MSTSSNPPCRILIRSKAGVELYTVPERPGDATPPQLEDPFLVKGLTSLHQCAPDGSAAYIHITGKGITKYTLADQKQAFCLPNTVGVQMLHMSPSGTYLLTWQRFNAETCPLNLQCWNAADGKLLAGWALKNLRRDAWPNVQWTADERCAMAMTTANQVLVYSAASILEANGGEARYQDVLKVEGITILSLPQTKPLQNMALYYFTSFVPATKNKPGRASLHAYTPGKTNSGGGQYPALLLKSLFQAEEMKTLWNPTNDAALIVLQTAVDVSGQSYYGSSQLFLLNFANKEVVTVPLDQEGPVLDVGWMPNPSKPPHCFAVVAGRMPSMATLHNGLTGEPLFKFGHAHRNTVSWSPHGRFLCLAGFGNLAGGMGLWDRNKGKLISAGATNTAQLNANGNLKAETTTGYGWSPDSRLFAASTCTPRMNVENRVRIYTYAGEQLVDNLPWSKSQYEPDKLLEATFVPAPLTQYPDRPHTPPPDKVVINQHSSAPVFASSSGKYVPPSARNRVGGGTSLAERLRKEKEGTMQGAAKVTRMDAIKRATPTVVGLAPSTKSKSAQRREKAKIKKQSEEQAVAAIQSAVQADESQEQLDPEKLTRKLKKLLKQIDDLKAKDPSSLNDAQKKKIQSEDEILKQLKELGI